MGVVELNGYTIEPGANLDGANLFKANLEGVDLTNASLVGAVLEKANLKGADLQGAKADENTTWRKGFDPLAAGVIFD